MPSASPDAADPSLAQSLDQGFQKIADVAEGIVMFEAPIAGVDVPLIVVWLIAGICAMGLKP